MAVLTSHDPVLAEFAEELGTEGPIAVAGGRTRWNVGGPLADGTPTVTAPAGVVDHVPEEMIVTVRAGTTVSDLSHILAEAGQRTALPDWGDGATVGGTLAVGENALDVLGRGRVRASVLQVRYISADGRIVTGGGPTVKNVTGFDLPRLMVGSLGTLGSLAEVILRTNPIPAARRWLRSAGADPFVARDAVLRPSAVLWDGTMTWVKLEGHAADVDAEQAAMVDAAGPFEEVDGPPELPPHRWSLTPAELRSLDARGTGAFVASIGVGTVWASQPQPARPVPAPVRIVAARMKAEFDPTERLNPGRDPYVR